LEKEAMKKRILLLFVVVVCSVHLQAQRVWHSSDGTITFTKAGFADCTQAANQDRISDSVWITRTNTQSIFNIKKESAYQTNSPVGTQWGFGTTAKYDTITYKTFVAVSNSSPSTLIGKDMVLHLVQENIYLDIKFLTYGNSSTGAPFSYIRAASPTSVESSSEKIQAFALLQNYPNPFNPVTTMEYEIQNVGTQYIVSLQVYNVLGKKIATLVNEAKPAGKYKIRFDASNLASGIYFVHLQNGNNFQMKKIVLLK
jgi:hypothetical protein